MEPMMLFIIIIGIVIVILLMFGEMPKKRKEPSPIDKLRGKWVLDKVSPYLRYEDGNIIIKKMSRIPPNQELSYPTLIFPVDKELQAIFHHVLQLGDLSILKPEPEVMEEAKEHAQKWLDWIRRTGSKAKIKL